jgi:hypothetical protein
MTEFPRQTSLIPGIETERTPQEISLQAKTALDKKYQRWFDGKLVEDEQLGVEELGWFAIYEIQLAKGWDWRKAVLIAWHAWPKEKHPKTQNELAKMCGLTSDRQFYKWRNQDPMINKEIQMIWNLLVEDEIREVDRANMEVAKTRDYKAAPDRRLFFLRHKLLEEAPTVQVNMNNVSKMSDAQLMTLSSSKEVVEGIFEEQSDVE